MQTGKSPGKLFKLAKEKTEISLKVNLLQSLCDEEVGTSKMEWQILKMEENPKSKSPKLDPGGSEECLKLKPKHMQKILEERDPKKVVDQLKLKVKYAKEEEEKSKQSYQEEKKRLERAHREEGKERKFRKIVERIRKMVNQKWKKGLEEITKKVQWSVRKFKMHKELQEKNEFQAWVERLATVKKSRKIILPKVNVYGGLKHDNNEKDLLSLPPKFLLYPEVENDNINLNVEMAKTKARYDRSNRDFNTEGDEVTEDENPRSKEEVLEENIHREKYNFDTKTIDFRGIRAIESMDSLIIHPWIL